MSEQLEQELAEAERRRLVAEQLRNEAPSLQEKLKFMSEELEATKEVLAKAEQLVDDLVLRSKEVHEQETQLYRKLYEILPKVVAEVKT